MAGKSLVLTDSKQLRLALDSLTKNTAIDMLLDLCHQEIGELASDMEIANWFTQTLEPVARVRGDKPINFAGVMARYGKASAEYVALHGSGGTPNAQ